MEEMRQETIEDLKKRNIWLCYDTVETERNKATAFYSAKSGAFLAKPEDFLKYGISFDEAKRFAEEHGYEGPAMIVPDGYCAVCIDGFKANHFDLMAMARFGTYKESRGDKVSIICRCESEKISEALGREYLAKTNREMYIRMPNENMSLFFGAFTDCAIPFYDNPLISFNNINDCTEAIICTVSDYAQTEYPDESDKLPDLGQDPVFIEYNERSKKNEINRALLAQYFRENEHYLIVRDYGQSSNSKYLYRRGCYRAVSDDEFKGAIRKFIEAYDPAAVEVKDLTEVMRQLETDNDTVPSSALDSNQDIINFRNGILNIRTLEFTTEHSPLLFSTIQIPCNWRSAAAPTPVFDRFMDDFTRKNAEKKKLLLEFMGAVFSNVPGYKMKSALFIKGKGDSGKSQLLLLCERILGDENWTSTTLEQVEERFGAFPLFGKRLGGDPDMGFVPLKELKTFKKLTGGDAITGEEKYKSSFSFVYRGLLWFCMNDYPIFGGDNGPWVYRRILPFEAGPSIPEAKQDKMLLEKMYAEREGIIHKAVMAFREIVINGSYRFSVYPEMAAKLKEYTHENNVVQEFWDECMTERKGMDLDLCTTGRVYKVFAAWVRDKGRITMGDNTFRKNVAAILDADNYKDLVVKRNSGNYYINYTLTDEAKNEYRDAYGPEILYREISGAHG